MRENASFAALDKFRGWWLLSRKKEAGQVADTFQSLAVKAPSIEAPILVALRRQSAKGCDGARPALRARLIVADEPTQGVDVGARAEIYRILREVSDSGTPVIVNSSDAAELEGLCDKVIVMSRGRVVATLTGDDVSKQMIVAAAVSRPPPASSRSEASAATDAKATQGARATSCSRTMRLRFR